MNTSMDRCRWRIQKWHGTNTAIKLSFVRMYTDVIAESATCQKCVSTMVTIVFTNLSVAQHVIVEIKFSTKLPLAEVTNKFHRFGFMDILVFVQESGVLKRWWTMLAMECSGKERETMEWKLYGVLLSVISLFEEHLLGKPWEERYTITSKDKLYHANCLTKDNKNYIQWYTDIPEWSWFMCLTSALYRLTWKLHNVHGNILLIVCIRRCTEAPEEFKNVIGQMPQLNGRWPVCSPTWDLRMFDVLNPFSQ